MTPKEKFCQIDRSLFRKVNLNGIKCLCFFSGSQLLLWNYCFGLNHLQSSLHPHLIVQLSYFFQMLCKNRNFKSVWKTTFRTKLLKTAGRNIHSSNSMFVYSYF